MREYDKKNSFELLDSLNSAMWFLMDASWMFHWETLAYIMIVPVVITGIASVVVAEKVAHVIFVYLALNCWIFMNVFWMIGDLHSIVSFLTVAKSFFFVGIFLLVLALLIPGNRKKTLSAFKRFRVK